MSAAGPPPAHPRPGARRAALVLVAMSGGVDSAVAAALLLEAGYRVAGVTLKLWCYAERAIAPPPGARSCCSLEDIADARRVAARLGIPHYVIDMQEGFEERVVAPFVEAYRRGRTPNPCVECNTHLKFGQLLEVAEALGAERIATGHHARCDRSGSEPAIRRAADPHKDQSYVLWGLGRACLERVLLPVGAHPKRAVRRRAAELGLEVAAKPDSQDICFVPDGRYEDFVRRRLGAAAVRPGTIEDRHGRVLGRHQGVIGFTIGQRRGLGIAAPQPLYVTGIEPETATVRVGEAAALEAGGLRASQPNWLTARPPAAGARLGVQVRSGATAGAGRLLGRSATGFAVAFERPQRAVVPGQSVALYAGDRLLGGGVIEGGLPATG